MNGLLLINKPLGLTSHDVVSRVRRILKTKEVGHSGTLDPLASGLMALLVGEATKLSSYITDGDKAYHVGFQLGLTTDTLDITGAVLKQSDVLATENEALKVARDLIGEMQLPIPLYSAKKIDGKKLYEYAREGVAIEQPVKLMKFWDINFVGRKGLHYEFELRCSKGSFIRSWVNRIGEILGCGAVMTSLVRTGSHCFSLESACTLEQLEKFSREEQQSCLIPLDEALVGVKKIRVKGQDAVLMKNGQISHQLRTQLISRFNPDTDEIIQILPDTSGHILALVGLEKGHGFRVKRVFNY